MIKKSQFYDAIVIGAGPVGTSTACALAQEGLKILLVDRMDPAIPLLDGRLLAIAHASKNLLSKIGVWNQVQDVAAPINTIKVLEGHSDGHATFDHQLIGDNPMGYMVEMPKLRQALIDQSRTFPTLTWKAPITIEALERNVTKATVTFSDGTNASAPLVIGADGKDSWVRQQTDINVTSWAYTQKAITCTIIHEHPHENIAYEWFFPGGPFAVLPQVSQEKDTHKSSIVLSEKTITADSLMELDDEKFSKQIQMRMGNVLGSIQVSGKRWIYPLTSHYVDRYTDQRLVLVGDAAHLVHPVAGQGLNMGFRDVAALAEVLVKAKKTGLDLGSAITLENYEHWRRFDNMVMIGSMDGLIRFFSNDFAPLKNLRRFGLKLVDRAPWAKKIFMRSAMGNVGHVPYLLK